MWTICAVVLHSINEQLVPSGLRGEAHDLNFTKVLNGATFVIAVIVGIVAGGYTTLGIDGAIARHNIRWGNCWSLCWGVAAAATSAAAI